MIWYIEVWKKIGVFVGRARRKEFWFFFLFNKIIIVVIASIDVLILEIESLSGGLSGAYALAVFIPFISVMVRRLHDTGRSGWWWFIQLIPLLGLIIFYFFMAQDSQEGDNLYGPNPKKATT